MDTGRVIILQDFRKSTRVKGRKLWKLPKMEVLPEELQEHWGKKLFKKCPESVNPISNGLASKVSTDYSKKEEASKATVEAALPSPWGRRLNVEDAMLQKRNKNDKYTSILQGVAVEFVEKLPTLPLTTSNDCPGECSHFPGVYLIYYVGETLLYGDLVKPSQAQPIYVGMSMTNILRHLKNHRRIVAKSEDLKETDFVVRLMIVDIECYAPCIEGILIDYFNPLWNNKMVKFSFDNAIDPNNNWYKYHVVKDKDFVEAMIERVRDCYSGLSASN